MMRLLRVGRLLRLLGKGRGRAVAVLARVLLRAHVLGHVGLLRAAVGVAGLRERRAGVRARPLRLLLLVGLLRDIAQERGEIGGARGRRLGAAGAGVRTGLALRALLHGAEELLQGRAVQGRDEVGEVGLAGGGRGGLGRKLLEGRLGRGLAVRSGRTEIRHRARILRLILEHGGLLLLGTGGDLGGNRGVKILVLWDCGEHDA